MKLLIQCISLIISSICYGQNLYIGGGYNFGSQKVFQNSDRDYTLNSGPKSIKKNSGSLSFRIGKPRGTNLILSNGYGGYNLDVNVRDEFSHADSDKYATFTTLYIYKSESHLKLVRYFYDFSANLSFAGFKERENNKLGIYFIAGIKYQSNVNTKIILNEGHWRSSFIEYNSTGDTVAYATDEGEASIYSKFVRDIPTAWYTNIGCELRIPEINNWNFSSHIIWCIPNRTMNFTFFRYRFYLSFQLSVYYRIRNKTKRFANNS